jgi:hypothetical protein
MRMLIMATQATRMDVLNSMARYFGTPLWAGSVGRDIVSPITKISPGEWSDTVNTVHEAAC